MEPFGGGKGKRSHFLLHISQCLRPPSLRRPPRLGPASLQLLRLLLVHKLVMAFPGERSTTQGAGLGLGGSASPVPATDFPTPSSLHPTSTPPPVRSPPPPHRPGGSGAPEPRSSAPQHPAPPPLRLYLLGGPASPFHQILHSALRGEETALHQLPRDPRPRPAASPPPLRLLAGCPAAAPAPPRHHPRAALPCGSASSRCSPPRRRARQQLAAPWPSRSAPGRGRPARLQTLLVPAGAPPPPGPRPPCCTRPAAAAAAARPAQPGHPPLPAPARLPARARSDN